MIMITKIGKMFKVSVLMSNGPESRYFKSFIEAKEYKEQLLR